MFSPTDILQEFCEAAVTIRDQSSDYLAAEFATRARELAVRVAYENEPWSKRQRRRSDRRYRTKPDVVVRMKEYQRKYYLARKASREAQEAVSG